MVNLLIIGLILIVAIGLISVVFIKKRKVNVPDGMLLLSKPPFKSRYTPTGGSTVGMLDKFMIVDPNPLSDTMVTLISFNNGDQCEADVSFSVISSELGITESRDSMIDFITISVKDSIKSVGKLHDMKEFYENKDEEITDDIKSKVKDDLDKKKLLLLSLIVDISERNHEKISNLYKEVGDSPAQKSYIELLEEQSKNETRTKEIESSKRIRLAEIDVEELKKLKEIKLEKQRILDEEQLSIGKSTASREAQLRNIRIANEYESQVKEEENRLKLSKMKSENDVKIAEQNSDASIRSSELSKKSKLAEIQSTKEVELAEIEKKSELNKKLSDYEIENSNMSLAEELAKKKNETELKRAEFGNKSNLHYLEVNSKKEELELTVTLPAKAEIEKNRMMAESKAEVKEIDTEASIKSSKAKLEYKKEEAKVLSEIRSMQDKVDSESYSSIMSISSTDPELAIKWKLIDKYEKIAQIQAEAMTKLNLSGVTFNGGNGDEVNKLISSMFPYLNQIKLPEIKSQKEIGGDE